MSLKRMGDTNTGFGDLRVTDSVVDPSSPVENCSFTPRWPITTRSSTRAWSQISLATMPVASVVSQGTPRSATPRSPLASSPTRSATRRERGVAGHAALGAALGERLQQHAAALAQRLTHLGRDVH